MSRVTASLFLACSLAASAEWSGKHPTAWTNQAAVDTATVWAASVSLVVTNWTATNAFAVTTNRFLDPIYGDNYWVNNPVTAQYTFAVQRVTTNNIRYATNETRVVTNALSQTSVVVRAREIISLDVWRAVRERARAIGTNWPVHVVYRGGFVDAFTPDIYGGHRKNLVQCKDWLSAYYARFVDPNTAVAFTNWTGSSFISPPVFTNRSVLLTRVNLPTNWLDYTPYRQLDGRGIAFTNASTLGTNTDLDYGYKYALNVLTNAVWTRSVYNYDDNAYQSVTANDDPTLWQGTGATNWSFATCGSGAAWTSKTINVANPCEPGRVEHSWAESTGGGTPLPYRYASGYAYGMTDRTGFVGQAFNASMSFRHGVGTTNFAHAADLYLVRAETVTVQFASTKVYTLDAYAYTFPPFATFTGRYYSVTSSADTAVNPSIGETDLTASPTWPTEPTTGTTATVRGYALTNAGWLIRWDVPGGFEYK